MAAQPAHVGGSNLRWGAPTPSPLEPSVEPVISGLLARMVSLSYLVLLLLVAVHAGEALKCYECNSRNDTACANEVPPESLKKDCSEHVEGHKYKLCRKIVQTIEYEVNGLKPDTRIIRSCGWDDSSYFQNCYQRSGFGGRQEVCTCSTDFCNGASASSVAAFLVTSLVFFPRLIV